MRKNRDHKLIINKEGIINSLITDILNIKRQIDKEGIN